MSFISQFLRGVAKIDLKIRTIIPSNKNHYTNRKAIIINLTLTYIIKMANNTVTTPTNVKTTKEWWVGEHCAFCNEKFETAEDVHEATLDGHTEECVCSHYEECWVEYLVTNELWDELKEWDYDTWVEYESDRN